MPIKPALLMVTSIANAALAIVTETEGLGHIVSGGFSAVSIVLAIGSVFVMREKVIRTEKEVEAHKKDTTMSLSSIAETFASNMKDQRLEHAQTIRDIRMDMRSDSERVSSRLTDIATALGRLEGAKDSHHG